MRGLVLALMLGVCVPALAMAQTPAAPTPAALIADTPQKTSSGAGFTAPQAWSVTSAPGQIILTPPEVDGRLAIIDIPQASDAADAVAKAWQALQPGFNRPVRLTTPRPARNGWDERSLVDYETSPNERLAIQALALRAGSAWTVMLMELSEATAEKRGAAANLAIQSLRPAGYSRETFAGRQAHPLDAARIEQMRAFVETSMAELGIPGAAFALYDQGKIVYEGGVGVREVGKPEPVDAHTLFMVASNTKSMVTLLLAQLVDEGKLRWDQPVTEIYPAFKLGSEATTRSVLVRHLVCACTGLPRKDMEWLFNTPPGTSASTTFTQLAATEPTSGFGEVFQYNNLMASAAGYIGGHLVHPDLELGAAFDAAMQDKIFNPLGMKDTTFDSARAERTNHARPHGDGLSDKPQIATMDLNYAAWSDRPAGGAWSSAHDMILYVENELRQGALANGGRIVSAENLLARRAPSVPTGEDAFYGMGLQTTQTWGVPVVHHGGSLAGYKSDIMLLPEAGVGAVILANADNGQMLLRPFMRRLVEVLYDGKPEAAADVAGAALRTRTAMAEFRSRLSTPPAAAPTAALAETYFNPDLGRLTVRREGADVIFQLVTLSTRVASRANDDGTVSFITIDPTNEGLEFVVADKDGQRALITRDSQHEYVFSETVGATQ
ncbi:MULTISPECIES: serine hydrolase domain-containing protein [unclassified Brevundimonas]|uniref:serine hydrolase domain-containing protein n=1 Tax=unclassified Brevundimonas TaxID=2622653 RepID=UPI003F92DD14